MKVSRAILCALVLVGCGGGGGGSDGAVDAPPGGNPDSDLLPPSDLERLEALIAALPGAPDDGARDALVDDFVTTVAYGGPGFPILDRGGLAVIVRDATPLALAGDFNAWSATAHPLVVPVPGFAFQAVIVPDAGLGDRSGYKLIDAGGTYRADPLARRYAYDEFGELSLATDGDQVHLERWPAFAGETTLRPRELRVLVPAGREVPGTRWPVLYAHDAQNLFDPGAPFGGWHALDAAAGAAPCLIVGIDNTPERMDEYTHVADSLGGPGTVGGRADEYLELLVDVAELAGGHYPIEVAVADHAIMGSSLGGLVSVYAAVRRPDLFGTAISLSGTMGWGRWGADGPTVGELITATPPTGVRFYLDSGGAPEPTCDVADRDNYCDNDALADRLRGLGWVDEDTLFYRHAPGAQHDEAAWAQRLPAILTTVFPGPP